MADPPALRLSRHALALGMREEIVTGTAFPHVVFLHLREPSTTLHVYLDGDGTPWRRDGPSPDPTPENPLVLDLMALDRASSVSSGGRAITPAGASGCSSALWTAERYSAAVVSSMEAALRGVMRRSGAERLAWVGYSGGGTLAVLLAPRFRETTDLVTIAANLDIDAWTDLHRHDRLVGSLNPARLVNLPATIRQRHYVGSRDRLVPPGITARGPIPRDALVVVEGYDHVCCWKAIWERLVSDLDGPSGAPASR